MGEYQNIELSEHEKAIALNIINNSATIIEKAIDRDKLIAIINSESFNNAVDKVRKSIRQLSVVANAIAQNNSHD